MRLKINIHHETVSTIYAIKPSMTSRPFLPLSYIISNYDIRSALLAEL